MASATEVKDDTYYSLTEEAIALAKLSLFKLECAKITSVRDKITLTCQGCLNKIIKESIGEFYFQRKFCPECSKTVFKTAQRIVNYCCSLVFNGVVPAYIDDNLFPLDKNNIQYVTFYNENSNDTMSVMSDASTLSYEVYEDDVGKSLTPTLYVSRKNIKKGFRSVLKYLSSYATEKLIYNPVPNIGNFYDVTTDEFILAMKTIWILPSSPPPLPPAEAPVFKVNDINIDISTIPINVASNWQNHILEVFQLRCKKHDSTFRQKLADLLDSRIGCSKCIREREVKEYIQKHKSHFYSSTEVDLVDMYTVKLKCKYEHQSFISSIASVKFGPVTICPTCIKTKCNLTKPAPEEM